MAKKKFYGVRKGYKTGIFDSWDECKRHISGYKGAEFKGFTTYEEAEQFVYPENKDTKLEGDYIEAYVDGSYEHSIKRYGSGIVILKNGEIVHKKYFGGNSPEYVTMRNVAGEIMASEYAMNYCIENNEKNLILYYDYKGIENWCTGEWKANKEGTIKYKDFYNKIKKKLNVRFVKVAAHSGNKYNDIADELAKNGVLDSCV